MAPADDPDPNIHPPAEPPPPQPQPPASPQVPLEPSPPKSRFPWVWVAVAAGGIVVLAVVAVIVTVLVTDGADDGEASTDTEPTTTTTSGGTRPPRSTLDAPRLRDILEGTDPDPSGPDSPSAAGTATCSNPVYGWSVEYPTDWYTEMTDPTFTCAVFSPDPVVIEPDTEIFAPVVISAVDFTLDVIDSYFDPTSYEIISTDQTTVGGFPAERIEVVATGEGFEDAGTVQLAYVVTLPDGSGFLLTATGPPDARYAEASVVLDQMAATMAL